MLELDLDEIEREFGNHNPWGGSQILALIAELRASREKKEELMQLLHSWRWLWNEGEITFEPLQWTQEGFDDLVEQTWNALHDAPISPVNVRNEASERSDGAPE